MAVLMRAITNLGKRRTLSLRRDILRRAFCSTKIGDEGKTVVSVLNKDFQLGLLINSYSQMGFRLNNNMVIVGPLAIFPKTVLSWNVRSAKDINEDSLSLFYLLEPRLDILVIGVGDANQKVDPSTILFMNRKKIALEILPTDKACTTFNFLNAEGRMVAGALIPPETLRVDDDDAIATKAHYQRMFDLKEDMFDS